MSIKYVHQVSIPNRDYVTFELNSLPDKATMLVVSIPNRDYVTFELKII